MNFLVLFMIRNKLTRKYRSKVVVGVGQVLFCGVAASHVGLKRTGIC